MKVGFTGTREGLTHEQYDQFGIGRIVLSFKPTEFHHGACVGADHYAACEIDMSRDDAAVVFSRGADTYGGWDGVCKIVAHPSNLKAATSELAISISDEVREPKPPLDRNRDIVDSTDILIACPKGPEERRSGTWSTIRRARKLGRRIIIIYPDGSIVEEPTK